MTVYVDQLRVNQYRAGFAGWRYKKSCHMGADNLVQLERMAVKLNLKAEWFQNKDIPHYDLTESKRIEAIKNGAEEISNIDFIRKLKKKWKGK